MLNTANILQRDREAAGKWRRTSAGMAYDSEIALSGRPHSGAQLEIAKKEAVPVRSWTAPGTRSVTTLPSRGCSSAGADVARHELGEADSHS